MDASVGYDTWIEHTSYVDDASPVTSLEYDNCYDLLWHGHANGRLSSYAFSDETQYIENISPEEQFASPPSMYRFTSTRITADAIVQILPNQTAVVAVSASKIRIITLGGAGAGAWNLSHCPSPTMISGTFPMLSSAEAAFTCADFIRDPTVSRTSSSYLATSLIAGTSTNGAYLFDLTQGVDSPVMVYNVAQPTVKIQSNGHIMVAAGQDGCLRLLDGKYRSNEVTKLIEAHTGSITDVCMQGDGRTLITCGTTKRAINPYDPKSPFHYGTDLQIRVFDLRMHRMIAPLPVVAPSASVTGVSCLRLVPQVDTHPVEYPALLMCTADGIVQVSNLTAEPSDPAAHQQLYAPLSDASELITTAAVAPAGQFLAVGTSSGVVGQYVKASAVATQTFLQGGQGMKSTELYRVNEMSPHSKTSPARDAPLAPPLLSLSVEAPLLGTAYVMNVPNHTPEMLSSSYAMTPAVLKRKLRLLPTSRISAELLSKSSARQGFIRTIPNPGYRPNSMKNVPKAATTVSALNGATLNPPYAICDPRKLQLLHQQHAHLQGLNSPNAAAAGNTAGAGGGVSGPGGAQGLQRSNSRQGSLDEQAEAGDGASAVAVAPKHYLRLSSLQSGSKQRFKKFDYASVNATPYVGLENNVPNSLINPILQFLYALPSIRDQALLSQTSPYHHQEAGQGSVMCEMGFLFHMMRLVGEYSSAAVANKGASSATPVDKVVRAANFQRIFQTLQLIPEAVALSLFDESLRNDLQQYIQALVPFLLRLLVRESELEATAASGGGRKGRNTAATNTTASTSTSANTTITASTGASTMANVVDETFGFSTLSSTTFLHSGVHKVDPNHNRALVLELVYPSLTGPVGGAANKRGVGPSGKGGISPVPSVAALGGDASIPASPVRSAAPFSYKVTGKKGRAQTSFAAVLWASFQREVSMKGWCAESDSFEPFKKIQSLVSLPRVLNLLCGNTQVDVKDHTTLAGAMGETVGQGTTHANFWSHPVQVTVTSNTATATAGEGSAGAGASSGQRDAVLGLQDGGRAEFAWLPVEVEVAFREETSTNAGAGTDSAAPSPTASPRSPTAASGVRFVVSCRVVSCNTSSEGARPVWIVFDGGREDIAPCPASSLPAYAPLLSGLGWTVRTFDLMSLVLQVSPPPPPALPASLAPATATSNAERKHLVLQLNKAEEADAGGWHLFNDFLVQPIPQMEVVTFPSWKQPCIVSFKQRDSTTSTSLTPAIPLERLAVPASVLQLESLSRTPSIRLLQSFATLPGAGDLIAFDGEFVSVSLEKSHINAEGERVVTEEVRQVLARISLLDMGHGPRDTESGAPGSPGTGNNSSGTATASNPAVEGPGATAFNKNMMRIIADDYILPVEPVLDYVTRFSGITEEDLNPVTSKHSILTQRAAYLKLRYFIDAKCIFVGHGLQKDFETANIFVPPEQIRDTVELWRLPNQRKISLRFLASYVLKEDIQDEIHDSIEDAKTSLLLYRKYRAVAAEGPEKLNAVLQDLYAYGNRNNWTIGLEKLNSMG